MVLGGIPMKAQVVFNCDVCDAIGKGVDDNIPWGWKTVYLNVNELPRKDFHVCETCFPRHTPSSSIFKTLWNKLKEIKI